MSDAAIRFESVWKQFRRGELHDSLRDLIPAAARRLVGRPREEHPERHFWALEDVSFDARWGEALGILGPNGAGKSTTLKLLTRILRPNRGQSVVRGRVGALIEVAAGFHPDLTGRENVFLQGAIMGMSRRDLARRLDAIIDFAGVEGFIDTPVKRYSSGMNARLGFAIAAHLDPDVLLIDEVLSVGDAAFQQRCVARMAEFKRAGVTLVFVSHNLQAVAELCDRAIYLKRRVRAEGPPATVIGRYLDEQVRRTTVPGQKVAIVAARLVDGPADAAIAPGTPMTLRVTYEAHETVRDLTFGFMVFRSTDKWTVYDAHFDGAELGLPELVSGARVDVDFRFTAHLPRGHFHLASHVRHAPTGKQLCWLEPAGFFAVTEYRTFKGTANLYVDGAVVGLSAPDGLNEEASLEGAVSTGVRS